MASNVFLYRMPAGIPGVVNREWAAVSEPNTLDTTTPPLFYGDPCKMGSNGKIQALAAGDTATAIYGFLERPNIVQGVSYASQGYGAAAPLAGARCTVMRSGYMTVSLQGATAAAAGGQIFVRINGTVPTGGHLGGLEAAVDGTAANTPAIPLPNSGFRGAADTGGNTEIYFNL